MKIRGYRYTRHSVCSSRVKWLCTESRVWDCHAIVVTIGHTMVDKQNKHTHPPNVQFIPTEKGKYILVLHGYTYSQVGGRFFYCSSKHTGCRARVRLTSGKLVASGEKHNHAPPSQVRYGNGSFIQLRPRGIPNLTGLTSPSAVFPSPITSQNAALLALHALNFPRLFPKTDLWLPPSLEKNKGP